MENTDVAASCKNNPENLAGRLVPNLILFFGQVLYEVKATGLQHSFNAFR